MIEELKDMPSLSKCFIPVDSVLYTLSSGSFERHPETATTLKIRITNPMELIFGNIYFKMG
ncbi:MAG: hypothetical protein ACC609_05360 [Methanobacterium formicicum]